MQTHQLDLHLFVKALKFASGADITLEDTHFIVANLISEGRIKGYISQQYNTLVVSKENAFPPSKLKDWKTRKSVDILPIFSASEFDLQKMNFIQTILNQNN